MYLITSGDSLLYSDGDDFKLLYDFSLQSGDTLTVEYVSWWVCDPTIGQVQFLVDSTTTRSIGGRDLRGLKLSTIVSDDGAGPLSNSPGWVFEEIGGIDRFYQPVYAAFCNYNCPYLLRCYDDGNGTTEKFWTSDLPCDTIIESPSSTRDIQLLSDRLNLFPNPATKDRAIVVSTEEAGLLRAADIELYTSDSKRVAADVITRSPFMLSFTVGEAVPPGVYYVRITGPGGVAVKTLLLR